MSKLLVFVILLTAHPVYAAELGCVGYCDYGTGTYYFSNGDRYEGHWRNSRRHGTGTYYYSNGNRYEGEWNYGDIEGLGTWYSADGDRYEGEWQDGKQHGQGTYYFNNGDRYEGDWKKGDIEGRGNLYFANGDRYEGEWKDDRKHGRGIHHFANGDHFKGEWVDGKRTKVEVCVLSVCFPVASWLSDIWEFVIALAFAIAVIVPLSLIFRGVRRKSESKRSEAVRSVALSLGMLFEDGRDIDAARRFGPFQLFSRGGGKKVRNCLSGTIDGVDVTTFGYEYTTEGEFSSTMRQTVVLFRSNELSLPGFELQPRVFPNSPILKATRKIVRTITTSIGRDEEIDFDTHPDFSESYVLKGNHKSAIHQVFSTRVLEYFERNKGLSVEGRDDLLLCYFSEVRLRPHEIKHFVKRVRPVLDLFRMKP